MESGQDCGHGTPDCVGGKKDLVPGGEICQGLAG